MVEVTSEVRILKPHVALNVRNVDASIAFYRKMFGSEPSKVRPGYAKFDLETPALNLSLNESLVSTRGALSHLGIQVAGSDDVRRLRERWVAAGFEVRDEIGTNCCYAIQDKTWLRDPDGNEWEAFAVLEDNLETSEACCGTGGEELVSIGFSTPASPIDGR